jgi:hypothetical protein
MRLKTLCVGFLAGVLGFGAMSCASGPDLPKKEMPAGATFSGRWISNEYGDMRMTQSADGSLHGTFDYKSGGTVDGVVTGGVCVFDWVQPGDFQVGRREVRGKGYFIMSDDGQEFEGEWGMSDNYTGGGKWTGRKIND